MTTQIEVVDINDNTNDNTDYVRGTADFVPPVEEVKPEEVKPKAEPMAKAKAKVREEINEEVKQDVKPKVKQEAQANVK